ncbi:MAG: metalloregulator ArsR/SmtB family transcription factor [Planctomycetes bacterium]|nr:metalloregulator ArsR/SmtB family transcription factor [Planctomycetota bacterium]
MSRRNPRDAGDSDRLLSQLAALGDVVRLRMLRLLAEEELSVGELARILQVPQSTASRHLKPLLDGGWIARRSEGTAGLYRMATSTMPDDSKALWEVARQGIQSHPEVVQDRERLASVLSSRRVDSEAFFGRVAGEWSDVRQKLFGTRATHEALLDLLDPATEVADLGCGTGEASEALAGLVRKVIAVDREKSMLDAAQKRLAQAGTVEFRRGSFEALPLKNGEVDLAVAMLVLHHIADIDRALREAARALKPQGRLFIVDMVPHDRRSYAASMGHVHLGFSAEAIRRHAKSAGFELLRYRRLAPDPVATGPGLFAALLRRS